MATKFTYVNQENRTVADLIEWLRRMEEDQPGEIIAEGFLSIRSGDRNIRIIWPREDTQEITDKAMLREMGKAMMEEAAEPVAH